MEYCKVVLQLFEFKRSGWKFSIQKMGNRNHVEVFPPVNLSAEEKEKSFKFVKSNEAKILKILRTQFKPLELDKLREIGNTTELLAFSEPKEVKDILSDLRISCSVDAAIETDDDEKLRKLQSGKSKGDTLDLLNFILKDLETNSQNILKKHGFSPDLLDCYQFVVDYELYQDYKHDLPLESFNEVLCAVDVLLKIERVKELMEENMLEDALLNMMCLTASAIKSECYGWAFQGLRQSSVKSIAGKASKKLVGVDLFIIDYLDNARVINPDGLVKKLSDYTEEEPWEKEKKGIHYELFLDSGERVQHKALDLSTGNSLRKDIAQSTFRGKNYYQRVKKKHTN